MSLKTVWETLSKDELSRNDCFSVDLESAANEIVANNSQYSLRAEGHLVYGLSQIWDKKAFYLYQDSLETNQNIKAAFSDILDTQPGRHNPINLDLNLNLNLDDQDDQENQENQDDDLNLNLNLPEAEPDLGGEYGDMSVDVIRRDGSAHDFDESMVDEGVLRSQEELNELDALNELDMDMGDNPPAPAELDFGPDLDYSSSPPHTPVNDDVLGDANHKQALETHIQDGDHQGNQNKNGKNRRRRQAVVDDEINTRIPLNMPARLKRKIETVNDDDIEVHGEITTIPLDPEIEKLVDLRYVEAEMKARNPFSGLGSNLGDAGQAGEGDYFDDAEHAERSERSERSEFEDLGMDATFDDIPDVRNLDFGSGDESGDDEDTEQKRMSRKMRTELQKSLEEGPVSFDSMVSEPQQRACMLMEVLILAAKNQCTPTQETPYGDIQITA